MANHKFVIVRRTDKPHSEAFDESGCLKIEALTGLKNVAEMSMNLLGGLFKIKHLRYVPKNNGNDKWINSKIKLRNFKNSFEIKTIVYPIYFVLNEIHRKSIPYNRRTNDPIIRKLYNNLKIKIPNEGEIESEGISSVTHKPVNLNYWHVEFLLRDTKTDQEIKRSRIKSDDNNYWMNKLSQTAFNDLLSVSASRDLSEIELIKIPKSFYKQ